MKDPLSNNFPNCFRSAALISPNTQKGIPQIPSSFIISKTFRFPSMAILTEEPDSSHSSQNKPTKKPKLKPSSQSPKSSNPNPFTFWFYFTISVSLLTLIFVTISSLTTQQDPKTWFLTLPTILRNHYSNGRIIKVQPTPHSDSIEVFTIQDGPIDSPHNILIVHGLGCSSYIFSKIIKSLAQKGVNVVALDLPGSGFSDKFETVIEERVIGGFGKLVELYNEIKEKGLFWGFDQLVEKGYVNYDYEENEIRLKKVESLKPLELGPEEIGRVLGQVIDTLGLAPVDLVLHDSAFNLGANWVAKNLGLVSSVTLIDSNSNQTAFPLWVLKFPVVRDVVSGFGFVFKNVIQMCCLKSGGGSESESHRLLLKGRNGLKSVVGMGKKMNSSFSIAEWVQLDGVKDLPMQVIWSEEWIKQGQQVAGELTQATFVTHSAGRWPQDDTADEVSENIYEFVSKLAKPAKVAKKKELIPERIRQMVDEATANVHHHGLSGHDHSHSHSHGHDHHHSHSHGYIQEVGYPSAYGLGNEFS